MDTKKITKIASLLITIIICVLVFIPFEYSSVGISFNSSYQQRLLYPFFHANLLHAILNAWCLLSVVFIYHTNIYRLLFCYLIAISIPNICLSTTPTIGLSGLVFALFGSISFEVGKKLYYQSCMLISIIIGFILPTTNGFVHLYCYLAGLVTALLNKPIQRK